MSSTKRYIEHKNITKFKLIFIKILNSIFLIEYFEISSDKTWSGGIGRSKMKN